MKSILALFNRELASPPAPQQAVMNAIHSADQVAFAKALKRLVEQGFDLATLRIKGQTIKAYITSRQRVAQKNLQIEDRFVEEFGGSECENPYAEELIVEIKSYEDMLSVLDSQQILSCASLALAAS